MVQHVIEIFNKFQGGFVDAYHNLSYKNIFGNFWVSNFCEQVTKFLTWWQSLRVYVQPCGAVKIPQRMIHTDTLMNRGNQSLFFFTYFHFYKTGSLYLL